MNEYMFADCNSIKELEKIINGLTHSGWECDGPMVYTGNGTDLDYYVQRMIREVGRTARFPGLQTVLDNETIIKRLVYIRELVKPEYIKNELTEIITSMKQ